MREILFKAKRLDGKGWVRGDLLQYLDGTCVIHWYDKGVRVSSEIDPSTVCQYTGLTDKNGVKIFEGDKLSDKYGDTGIVRYGIQNCGCCHDVYGFSAEDYDEWLNDDMMVIGNIHD